MIHVSGSTPTSYSPLEAFAAIGNCRTAALVSNDGVISFWCPGRFDAPAALLQLLDTNQGGFFSVVPEGQGRVLSEMTYLPDTNVLATKWRLEGNEGQVIDFMPVELRANHSIGTNGFNGIVRMVECTSGEMTFRVSAKITPAFADPTLPLTVEQQSNSAVVCAGTQRIVLSISGVAATDLHQEVDPTTRQPLTIGTLVLKEGQKAFLILEQRETPEAVNEAIQQAAQRDWGQDLRQTINVWHFWAQRCSYQGRYGEVVRRSLLALKLMQYEPTGAFVAALTTSLPEEVGGARNWDYRFTWLRDASLTVDAFLATGYLEEAASLLSWLKDLPQVGEFLQLMYHIDGEAELTEQVLPHLEGYMGSAPVRVGNEAAEQVQLDSYGYMLNTIQSFGQLGGFERYPNLLPPMLRLVRQTANFVWENWPHPDNSLWEIRDEPRHYVSGKVMCWTALDRAITVIATYHGRNDSDISRWEEARQTLHEQIRRLGFNKELGAFTQAYGSTYLDASLLLLPQVGFISPYDPHMIRTVQVIMERLGTQDGFLLRYDSPDGLEGEEGTFLICTGWLARTCAMLGHVEVAETLLRRLLDIVPPYGLLAEEYDPNAKRMQGNYPQAFTHLALILAIIETEQPRERQGHTE
jgi:GH15 family glucan-1,4-alpha-glucosidase